MKLTDGQRETEEEGRIEGMRNVKVLGLCGSLLGNWTGSDFKIQL